MNRYQILIEYVGTNFRGWQIQKTGLTVQGLIQKNLKNLLNEKIVLIATFAMHRKDSTEACNYIMNYLKKDAPFWKKEIYKKNYKWLRNIK